MSLSGSRRIIATRDVTSKHQPSYAPAAWTDRPSEPTTQPNMMKKTRGLTAGTWLLTLTAAPAALDIVQKGGAGTISVLKNTGAGKVLGTFRDRQNEKSDSGDTFVDILKGKTGINPRGHRAHRGKKIQDFAGGKCHPLLGETALGLA